MGNEKDWEELNKWRMQKEEEQKADLERRNIPNKGLKAQQKAEKSDTITGFAKFVHLCKDAGNAIIELKNEVKLLIVTCIACFIMIIINTSGVPNANKVLESRYEETTELVSTVKLEKGAKFHTYKAKGNPTFYFHVVTSGRNDVAEDLKQCQFQYFYEKLDNSLKDNIEIDMQTTEEGLITKYEVRSLFKNFSEIDDAIETLFQLRAEIEKIGGPQYESMVIRGENGITPQVYHLFNDIDAFAKEAKRQYVSMVRVGGLPDDTITKEDLKLYCRPDAMKVFINGQPVIIEETMGSFQLMAHYSNSDDEYKYTLYKEVLEMIPGVIFKEPAGVYEIVFEYDKKEYNTTKIGSTEKDIRDIFGATFEYDYANGKVNIVIP